MINKRIAALVASGALAASVAIAAPASANNYAPGLPPAEVGVPNNPPNPYSVAPTIELVSAEEAAQTPVSAYKKAPEPEMGDAPKGRAEVGDAVKLVSRNLTPNATFVVEIKRKGGSYATLGSTVATPTGSAVLPAFIPERKGVYIMALRNVQTNEVVYLKIRAR